MSDNDDILRLGIVDAMNDIPPRIAKRLQAVSDKLPKWAKSAKLPAPDSLGNLLKWSASDLFRINGFGPVSRAQLRHLLTVKNLCLRGDEALLYSKDEILNAKIHVLSLSPSVQSALMDAVHDLPQWAKDAGLPAPRTVDALIQWNLDELLKLSNLGHWSVREIKQCLAQENLCLRGEVLTASKPPESDTLSKPAAPPSPSVPDNLATSFTQIFEILHTYPPPIQRRILRALNVLVGE